MESIRAERGILLLSVQLEYSSEVDVPQHMREAYGVMTYLESRQDPFARAGESARN